MKTITFKKNSTRLYAFVMHFQGQSNLTYPPQQKSQPKTERSQKKSIIL